MSNKNGEHATEKSFNATSTRKVNKSNKMKKSNWYPFISNSLKNWTLSYKKFFQPQIHCQSKRCSDEKHIYGVVLFTTALLNSNKSEFKSSTILVQSWFSVSEICGGDNNNPGWKKSQMPLVGPQSSTIHHHSKNTWYERLC